MKRKESYRTRTNTAPGCEKEIQSENNGQGVVQNEYDGKTFYSLDTIHYSLHKPEFSGNIDPILIIIRTKRILCFLVTLSTNKVTLVAFLSL